LSEKEAAQCRWSYADEHGISEESIFVTWGTTFADAMSWCGGGYGSLFTGDEQDNADSFSQRYETMTDEDRMQSFHTETRLQDGTQGILIDPGSIGNLAGDSWVVECCTAGRANGRYSKQVKRDRPLRVSGVGEGSQEAKYNVIVPVCMKRADGSVCSGTFETPAVKNSPLPSLLGLASLTNRRAVLDLQKKMLYFLGPGDYTLADAMPPGTESFELRSAPSGHLLLPCSHFKEFDQQQSNGDFKLDETSTALIVHQAPPCNIHSQYAMLNTSNVNDQ